MSNDFTGVFLGVVPIISGFLGGYLSRLVVLEPDERNVRLLIGGFFSGVCCTVIFFFATVYIVLTGHFPAENSWVTVFFGLPVALYLSAAFAIPVGVIWLPVGVITSLACLPDMEAVDAEKALND
ncbi:hypothetical protein BCF46_0901 [Litoreibacter meonggei]|uniref:Uncharacterized protein n=1 Tax=Litoreibacter meonggei TaxID=1049199 RepID=A0A497X5V7_9RHOB|nr:hypothetical protein [Litoreibacter meonggei]RLJ60698.1 hypothetical protein BCF46_0901 [Litoreibacter meonggei]